ncbi:hypothetical protein IDAT_01060 [Pseudidiomarina atlantica]|uniref:Acyltransferase 3 domain-containing protein n=1 Tax=Pseudidiomarina atlantica TaxID=1517416 RepID=A0A094L4W0_9GAMM|nr:acyltransferase family protein [Pseudidiomarina atlantica]KFZ29723.1 hypothetical protein IDAT_01060 [Pseudidiomarina atlantica]
MTTLAARAYPQITWDTSTTLDSLRVIACAIVLLSHVYEFSTGNLNNPVNETISYIAVACFFFISGWVNTHSIRTRNSTKQFYEKRFFRIVPTYVFALVLGAVVFILVGGNPLEYLSNLVFLNPFFGTIPTNAPLWSLPYEIYLYALLPLLLGSSWYWSRFAFVLLILLFTLLGHPFLFVAFYMGCLCYSFGLQLPRLNLFSKYGKHTYEIYVFHYPLMILLWGLF